jgi:alpha-D-xyloside xylohydrolase
VPEDDLPAPTRKVPRWAFSPWISKDISDRDDTYAFVDGFRARGIPVGTVVLDSPWETHYNTFIPSPTRYPAFGQMVSDMHARGVRVVLWTTQMVNSVGYDLEPGGDRYVGSASNFDEGELCGFYVNQAEQFFWWKGKGCGVDFFNARARTWWHRQQNTVLDVGIDGFKLDFGESYIKRSTLQSAAGDVSHQAYSERYYEDFLAYGQKRRGPEFMTMVRAWDESYEHAGRFFARKEHAPISWMGDNRRDWVGLIDALDHMFISARAGYIVVGSDLGGYLDRDDKDLFVEIPFDARNFAKWTAQSALTPFMQLHGRGNLTPWTVPDRAQEIERVYRKWAILHEAMVPYFLGVQDSALAGNARMIDPVGEPREWVGDYRYFLGDALLVAPELDGRGEREVAFPTGAEYYGLFDGTTFPGGSRTTFRDGGDLGAFPVYLKEGGILPMRVTADTGVFGDASAAGSLTLVVAPPRTGLRTFAFPDPAFGDPGRNGEEARGEVRVVRDGAVLGVDLPPSARPWRVLLRSTSAPLRVSVDGRGLLSRESYAALGSGSEGYAFTAAQHALWVFVPAGARRISIE